MSDSLNHKFENTVWSIKRLAESIARPLGQACEYLEDNQVDVLSARELEILKESMQILCDEADNLIEIHAKMQGLHK
jgi:hypothetical protein